MKNRNLNHSDNWATPKEFYDKLNSEFAFDFDPCPLNENEITPDKDGLLIEWGNNLFINFFSGNFVEWKNYNAQSVKSTNLHQILHQEPIDQEVINLNAKNVYLIEIANEIGIKEKNKESLLKNTNWKNLDCKDALNARLLNHLIKIILVLTENANLDIHPIVKNVQENLQEKQWLKEEKIQRLQSLLKIIRTATENQIEEEISITKEIESEIINVDQRYFSGQYQIGKSVSYTLQTNVSIVNQKKFLFKTILYLYQMIIAQEQSQQISSHLVSDVTVQKTTETLMNGLLKSHLKELENISLRLNHKANIFINPPYSRNLKEAFVMKAIEESKKGKLCVMLLPVSTSTKLFHDSIKPNAKEIRFIKGRIKFIGVNTKGELVNDKAPMHDSMIVIFDGRNNLNNN